jgi:glc operon protein GlcG
MHHRTFLQRWVLSHEGALKALGAAMQKAQELGVPECIAVVDDAGHLLAFVRMDGAKFLSIETALNKAVTAVSGRKPTGAVTQDAELKLAIATQGKLINLKGGLPLMQGADIVGGIGVGSGTGDQDLVVAQAGADALAGIPRP